MNIITLNGSCLCGAVLYQASGEITRFTHCHCSRCRKATGTGHATNLIMKQAKVEWIQGGELVHRYKVPTAERFTTSFCSECGAPLPRFVAEMAMAVMPAGSLDQTPGIKPQAHIFWDSRTDWSCAEGGLPVFAEYPPGV